MARPVRLAQAATILAVVLLVPRPAVGDEDDRSPGSLCPVAPGTRAVRVDPSSPDGLDTRFETVRAGDLVFVVRSGGTDPFATLEGAPPPRTIGVAEPLGEATPVPIVAGLVRLVEGSPWAVPAPEAIPDGTPVLFGAFADLDGDGFIGITNLDGDERDAGMEQNELDPVGLTYGFSDGGRVLGLLDVRAGGPPGAPLRVVLAAATWAGPMRGGFLGGTVPDGPFVSTALPFPPEVDPTRLWPGGGPPPADPGWMIGVPVWRRMTPDPDRLGETFTIPTSGCEPTVDAVDVRSGTFARFGLAKRIRRHEARPDPARPIRPGLGDDGERILLRVVHRLRIGSHEDRVPLRIVPIDRLGNVTAPPAPEAPRVRTSGRVRISSGETDREEREPRIPAISSPSGANLVLEVGESEEEADDAPLGRVVVEGDGGLFVLDVAGRHPDRADLARRARARFGPLPDLAVSPSNPVTDEKVALGRHLFYDPRLSSSGRISCNSCHDLASYGVDGEPTSPGHAGQRGDRNSPTVYNAALHVAQFWDGRAPDVEAQAKGPVLNPIEMAMPDPDAVTAVLRSIPGYVAAFGAAFPGDPESVSFENMARAIGAFERSLITPSRFDEFMSGDPSALSSDEVAGLDLFMRVGCPACHMGPTVGGTTYQRFGGAYAAGDPGRQAVTGLERDRGVFKVPSLRNVERTGPWLHDGSVGTLREMVVLMGRYQLGRELSYRETSAILDFLGSLTAPIDLDLIRRPLPFPSGP